MTRKLMILLAFLATAGQAIAAAAFSGMSSVELVHVLTHAQADVHHHHDDGGMHVDEAEDASFHLHVDGANVAAPPAPFTANSVHTTPQGPPGWEPRPYASPVVKGPLRPPKIAS